MQTLATPTPHAAAGRPDRLITVAQAVQRLGITRALCYRMIRDGRLPAVRLGKRTVRVRLSIIEKLMDQAAQRAR